ncbi:fructose-bisphosphate aldolase [Streptacidiphilus pinicola]|uniref:Fructose-bisphosphate aldolase n=1 Tax=Streptacidiphilus pinicola TaxID=2219663 RepID=A0A2X0JVC2_9ACTN|nr:class II fructose-bisphosphate aldolase [Streptacidiphilus pinicola]RAG80855.1 fructose-bisphosphate aldolase [Streptacidiphilus pinicola]
MPLVPLPHLLAERPVFAFNVIQIEHAEAILAGAEQAKAAVVLQISENAVRYHGALAPLAAATRLAAERSGARAALHLDHATEPRLVHEAADCGFGSVMYDGSTLPWEENLATTAEMATWCHANGLAIEAELGEVGGKDGAHAPGVRTDPAQAAEFVARTGVDALAVAVGSEHAMTTRTASLDLELIGRLRDAVPVPLVLHGSSGVPDATLVAAVEAGMRKINVSTHLNRLFTEAVRDALATDPKLVDPRKWLAPGRDAVAAEVARLLGLLNAVG